eukprot:TRINITY_DN12343_c0_g1_i1.p1 TRINITY_DN12343_c0_g1~~TRINITY_DN12343_c0_g1_i1.p1  ORF type:complete len:1380 (+),score=186.73 TRINITY_DN12343_c0_g1_i1:109-4248(+)
MGGVVITCNVDLCGSRLRAQALACLVILSALGLALASSSSEPPFEYRAPSNPPMGFLEIREGYFYDPVQGRHFFPHGMAYQTWNRGIFQFQTLEQVEYDLREMKRMRVNSVRVEFNYPDNDTNVYDWRRLDFLVNTAADLHLRLFPVIGHQNFPEWLREEDPSLLATHYDQNIDEYGTSAVINYNNPRTREIYAEYVATIADRYRDATCVGAWIVGNEFAFYNLLEDLTNLTVHRFLGFDEEYSIPSYRMFLEQEYSGDIERLNANWNTDHQSFSQVPMAPVLPLDRELQEDYQQGGIPDLIRWRKHAIGEFLAVGAKASKDRDPNHLITYAMLGGIFDGNDANFNCEDARVIIQRCEAAGAPLDFFTINNYPWLQSGAEVRSGDFGVSKYRDQIAIPLMVSETGLSDTDVLFPETPFRLAGAMEALLWEPVMSGAIGVHIFVWNDRDVFNFFPFPFEREAGFGVLRENRTLKRPLYERITHTFQRMEEIDIARVIAGSQDPANDVLVYWPADVDLGFNRANQELAFIWAAYKRVGLQIGVISEEVFRTPLSRWATADKKRAILLPRNFQMDPSDFEILDQALDAGVSLHFNGDVPGRFNQHHAYNDNWSEWMKQLFGISVDPQATPAFDSGLKPQPFQASYRDLTLQPGSSAASGESCLSVFPQKTEVWKVWHDITAGDSIVALSHLGVNDTGISSPALTFYRRSDNSGASASGLFPLGDLYGTPPYLAWIIRRNILCAIYLEHFGIRPQVSVEGEGADLISVDWRHLVSRDAGDSEDGPVLLSLLNLSGYTAAVVTVDSPLLQSRLVIDLTHGWTLSKESDERVGVTVLADELVVLHLVPERDAPQYVVAFQESTSRGWTGSTVPLFVNLSISAPPSSQLEVAVYVESILSNGDTVVRASSTDNVVGSSFSSHTMFLRPEVSYSGESNFVSTIDGGIHQYRCVLRSNGQNVAESRVSVELYRGLDVVDFGSLKWARAEDDMLDPEEYPGHVEAPFNVTIQYEMLPSYLDIFLGTPITREDVWTSTPDNGTQAYTIQVELRDCRGTRALSFTSATSRGIDHSHVLSIFEQPSAERYCSPMDLFISLTSAPPDMDLVEDFSGLPAVSLDWEDLVTGRSLAGVLPDWEAFASGASVLTRVSTASEDCRAADASSTCVTLQATLDTDTDSSSEGFGMIYDFPVPSPLHDGMEFTAAIFCSAALRAGFRMVDENSNGATASTAIDHNEWKTLVFGANDFVEDAPPNHGFTRQMKRIAVMWFAQDAKSSEVECSIRRIEVSDITSPLNAAARREVFASVELSQAIEVSEPMPIRVPEYVPLSQLDSDIFGDQDESSLDVPRLPLFVDLSITFVFAAVLVLAFLSAILWQSSKFVHWRSTGERM